MAIPYYKQQTPFTCALACLRMVLESVGRKVSEYELSKVIGFDIGKGYSMPMLRDILDIMNIGHELIPDADVHELKTSLSNHFYPIVILSARFYKNVSGDHGHIVIVKDITDKTVIINDPDQEFGGENKGVDLGLFVRAWSDSKNWMLVIKGENK